MRLGIIPKFLIPLSLLFACLTFVTKTVIQELVAENLFVSVQNQSIGNASQAAMMLDASGDLNNLKRVVTLIALDEHVTRAIITERGSEKILASSFYYYANNTLSTLPSVMREAIELSNASGRYEFTQLSNGEYALAYPVVTIESNNIDTREYMLTISFDNFVIQQEAEAFANEMTLIAWTFLVMLVVVSYFLLVFLIKRPLEIFEQAIVKQAKLEEYKKIELGSRDEFGDIAEEFNRMQAIELSSLVAAQKATEAAEALAKKKSQFLANMSHELRTPINGIMGLAQLCLQTPSKQQQQRYLTRLMESSNLLLTVVNDILDFSKLNQNAMSLAPETSVLSSSIEPIIHLIQVMADDKRLDFKVVMSKHVPYSVYIDPQRLQQVLLNILNNAIKFTDSGRVVLNIDYEWFNASRGQLKFSVRDTGIGMTEAQIDNLFTPFEQADSSISRHYGGTGLGLSICDQLVSLMGGSINVSAKPDKGSLFVINVPCEAQSIEAFIKERQSKVIPRLIIPEPVSARTRFVCETINQYANINIDIDLLTLEEDWSKKPFVLNEGMLFKHIDTFVNKETTQSDFACILRTKETGKSHRILLVEDNEINAIVADNMLSSLGYQVSLAENGAIAVEMHKREEFDAIIMDIQMPIMDGIEATRLIRQTDRTIYIIGLSANVLDEDKTLAIQAGMNDYLHKPILQEALASALSRLLI